MVCFQHHPNGRVDGYRLVVVVHTLDGCAIAQLHVVEDCRAEITARADRSVRSLLVGHSPQVVGTDEYVHVDTVVRLG